MSNQIFFNKTSLVSILNFRHSYLKSLVKFQDIYLEFLIEDSLCYEIVKGNKPIGYCIITTDNEVVEFYVEVHDDALIQSCFNLMLNVLKIEAILCKSFDRQLFSCCSTLLQPGKEVGYLFREFEERNIDFKQEIKFRFANSKDLQFLEKQNDEVFEPKHHLMESISSKSIIIAENDAKIIGCGFKTQVHASFNYFDLGVWVDECNRKQGIATQLMDYMLKLCKTQNEIPICGCDYNNKASYGLLTKIGFKCNDYIYAFEIVD